MNKASQKVIIGFVDLKKPQLKDYLINHKKFKSVPEFCTTCLVLTDVLNAFKAVVSDVDVMLNKMIKKIGEKKANVRIIGTGYGGAQANLYAVHAKASTMNQTIILYTFGAIRVGNKEFANYSNDILGLENSFRVVYKKDPLPMVPYKKDGFKHAGMLYHISVLPRIEKKSENDSVRDNVLYSVYFYQHYHYSKIFQYNATNKADDLKQINFDKIKTPVNGKKSLEKINSR